VLRCMYCMYMHMHILWVFILYSLQASCPLHLSSCLSHWYVVCMYVCMYVFAAIDLNWTGLDHSTVTRSYCLLYGGRLDTRRDRRYSRFTCRARDTPKQAHLQPPRAAASQPLGIRYLFRTYGGTVPSKYSVL